MKEQAVFEAMEQLEAEWEAVICAVCGGEKWANYPFCRSCSIRLQRIGLMQMLKGYAGWEVLSILRHPENARDWASVFDRARDYLITRRGFTAEAR